jgi:[ribosomal protein S5]-alanine N-acetyltransferase
MIVLETNRLILREFVIEDLDAVAAVLSDPETMRFYPAPLTRNEVAEWITRNLKRYARDGHAFWAMILKSSGEFIGNCGLICQMVDGIQEVEIGYQVRRSQLCKGYASEAAQACRDYGFSKLPVKRLVSLIRPENLPSRRVAEKNGMTAGKETMLENMVHLVYAIDRSKYVERKQKL